MVLQSSIQYRNQLSNAGKQAYSSTCHFLKVVNKIPQPHGTGVFDEIRGNYFLFTAGHVLDDYENNNLCVDTDEHGVIRLGGEVVVNKTTNREDDIFDIGIIKLSELTYSKIKSTYNFIPEHELQIYHQDKYTPQYVTIGFPSSKSKYNSYKNALHSSPFLYITKAAIPEVYAELQKDNVTNIVVHYDKSNVLDYDNNTTITGPDAFGMSGSGLWHIPQQVQYENGYIKKELVAILIEWPIKNRKYFVGRRIGLFIEVIKYKYNIYE